MNGQGKTALTPFQQPTLSLRLLDTPTYFRTMTLHQSNRPQVPPGIIPTAARKASFT